jgi:hypothetical protein
VPGLAVTFARTAGLLVVSLSLALWPEAVGLEPAMAPAAALVLAALGFWATGALPFHLTALGLCSASRRRR